MPRSHENYGQSRWCPGFLRISTVSLRCFGEGVARTRTVTVWLCLGHMRITGSPGSYGPIRLGNLWDSRTKLNLLRCCGHMHTGGLRGCYGFTTMFWRRGRKNPYGYRTVHVRVRTVHVRALYGPVRASEHPYDHCTWPVRVPVMAVCARTGPERPGHCTRPGNRQTLCQVYDKPVHPLFCNFWSYGYHCRYRILKHAIFTVDVRTSIFIT